MRVDPAAFFLYSTGLVKEARMCTLYSVFFCTSDKATNPAVESCNLSVNVLLAVVDYRLSEKVYGDI